MGVQEMDLLTQLSLPPGFRFYPTDEELLVQYLCRKVAGPQISFEIIGEIDLYKFDPWVLPRKAIFGEKEWYFFSPRDRKYPNGSRPNRVAGSGYWKATGTDKIITTEGRKVGIKKALVFYVGKAPKGAKTNWIMHEYRLLESSLQNKSSKLDDWVLCRIYKKNSGTQKLISSTISSKEHSNNGSSSSSHHDDVMDSLPENDNRFLAYSGANPQKATQSEEKMNFNNLDSGNFNWVPLGGLNSMAELVSGGGQTQAQAQAQGTPSYFNSGNDLFVSSLPPQVGHVDLKMGNSIEEEVQSGTRTRRDDYSGVFQQNQGVLTQNYCNSLDPYGFGFLSQPGSGFGFRQ